MNATAASASRSPPAERSLAAARDRVLAAACRSVLRVSRLSRPRQPDPDRGSVRRLARSDPRLCGHRIARSRRVLRHRRVYGRTACRPRMGRAIQRTSRRGGDRGARRFRGELPRRARRRSDAADGDARHRPHGSRGRQQGRVHHRRRRRTLRRHDVEGRRTLFVRHGRPDRVPLQPRRAVPAVHALCAASSTRRSV